VSFFLSFFWAPLMFARGALSVKLRDIELTFVPQAEELGSGRWNGETF
jgi:hypothetical protein